ncbi:hypothetical protein ILYODFUR_014252, partial [Ilyodon furcidens]
MTTSSSVSETALKTTVEMDLCLDCFDPVELPELSKILPSSKLSTCMLDPIPTKLLKDVFPLITSPILDMINLVLVVFRFIRDRVAGAADSADTPRRPSPQTPLPAPPGG